MNITPLREDLLSVLIPERKWHYVFHFLVVLVSSSYWIGSLVALPEGSLAEIILYRPGGDTQVWPIITSLSQLNFGDPTDAIHYGRGIASVSIPAFLPYMIACGVFGKAG